ncbi:hypothetical protein [Mycobacterium shigaense]|uniref:hypothetical protein n=1 Tax=Mycobacterium shigaense TaxID=722731 RepID=UPI000E56EAC0|nr:hypothetical protein [Mycobacterium shigaense]
MVAVRAVSGDGDPDRLRGGVAEFPVHPTLSQIAQRQNQIDTWDALRVGGYRFAKPGTIISFLLTAAMVVLVVTPVPPNWPWDIPLCIVSIFSAVVMVVCGLLWLDRPSAGPRPELLEIVPFTRAENLQLMRAQPAEPYCATCVCPGCGDESTHLLRKPSDGEPDWATVTRRCRICQREWAQA